MKHRTFSPWFLIPSACFLLVFLTPGHTQEDVQFEVREDRLQQLINLRQDDISGAIEEEDDEETESSEDFGVARILAEPEPYKYFRIRAGLTGGHNNNIQLQPTDEQADQFNTQFMDFSFLPKLNSYIPGANATITGNLQSTKYYEFHENYSFSSFVLSSSGSYRFTQSGTQSAYLSLQYMDVFDGMTPGESTQEKGIVGAGYRSIIPFWRFHQLIGSLGVNTEKSYRVAGDFVPGDFADSAKTSYQASLGYLYRHNRTESVRLNARYEFRDYHHQGSPFQFSVEDNRQDNRISGSASLNYRVSPMVSTSLNGSLTVNDSNQQDLLGRDRDYTQWQLMWNLNYSASFHGF